MIKFIVAAVWLCSVTVATVLWSAQAPAPAGPDGAKAKGASPLLGGLDYIKTDVISVPVVHDQAVIGYFLARLVYTADQKELDKLSVPAETLLTDQVYTYLYGNPQIDFTDKSRVDIDAFRNGLRDSVNKRIGEPMLHDVMVQQIDFLSKDEIRDNVIRRRTGGGQGGAGGDKKVLSPSSHF